MTYNPDGPNTHMPADDDPYASAGSASLRPREYFGQLTIDAWYCKLVKSQGKVPWDKTIDSIDSRMTALTVELQPVAGSNLTFALKRELIAESAEWVKIMWPSLRTCGVQSVKAANGIWCKLIQEPTGRKYRSSRTGMEQDATTFKVLTVYPDQVACEAAFAATHPNRTTPDVDDEIRGANFDGVTGIAQGQPKAQQAAMPLDDTRKRETARQFLLAIARQKKGDLEAVRAAVATMPMITQAFDPESSEFLAVVAEAV